MKKFLSFALAALMLAVTMLTLSACGSAYSGIEKNFLNAGFEVVDISDAYGEGDLSFMADMEEGSFYCTIHVLRKGNLLDNDLQYAVIAEYGADQDAREALDEYMEGNLSSVLMDLDQSRIVRENCLLIPINANINFMKAEENIENMIELFNR